MEERDADMEEGSGKGMSDADAGGGREVSQRFADVEDELRQGDNLGALMAEQWRGMAAAMVAAAAILDDFFAAEAPAEAVRASPAVVARAAARGAPPPPRPHRSRAPPAARRGKASRFMKYLDDDEAGAAS